MSQKFVYDIDDLFYKWQELMSEVKTARIKEGKDFYQDSFDSAFAACLLLYYRLTQSEIIQIRLDDLSKEGIRGFNIQFDKKSLDFLLKYKDSKFYHRNTPIGNLSKVFYKQNTLIRTADNDSIAEKTIGDMFAAKNFVDTVKANELRNMFTPKKLNDAGKFNELYKYGELVGYPFIDTSKSGRKMILEHINDLCNILRVEYDPEHHQTFTHYLKEYRNQYYNGKVEWEQNKKQAEESVEEVINESTIESKNNQELLVDKLLNKIASMETEIQEMKDLINLLK